MTYRKSKERHERARAVPPEPDASGIDLRALDGLAGFLIRMVQLRMFQAFHARFAASGLNPGALCALVAIGANPRVRSGALGDALLIKRSNMTKLVDALERQGLVKRTPSNLDRRSVELRLTEAGRARIAAALPQVTAYEEEALRPLSMHEGRVLIGLPGKLNEGMARSTV